MRKSAKDNAELMAMVTCRIRMAGLDKDFSRPIIPPWLRPICNRIAGALPDIECAGRRTPVPSVNGPAEAQVYSVTVFLPGATEND